MKTSKSKLSSFSLGILILMLSATFQQAWGQCNNGSPFGSAAAPTGSTPITITTCAFGGEYSTISGAVAGSTYQFTGTGGAGNYITIRQGSPGGTVLAFGFSPVSATCTASGPLYLHLNTDAGCGTDATCHTTTIQCTSCAAPPPGQCLNFSQFGSATIDPGGAQVTISSCNFAGEYSPIFGAVSGQQLRFTSSFAGDNVTIRSGTFDGPVVAFGPAPLTFTNTYTGTLFAHWNLAGCGTDFSCRTTTVQCLSCGAFDPCASTPTINCGTSTTASISGSGAWSPGSCGFSTPGQERVYVFTPTNTGVHSLQVTATDFSGYIDYFFKPVSNGCDASGWTCIDDIFSPVTVSLGTLTAGTSYYLLLDPETTSAVSQSFQINCPVPSGAPPCVTSPSSPTNGQTNICPSPTQTLSWPAVSGATSYDVYFGTTANPSLVANTLNTSYVASTPTTGTYFWQIRPVNIDVPAVGCTVWSFTKSDTQAPIITCPANSTVNNTPGQCGASPTYGISGTDNCSAPQLTQLFGFPSGAFIPVGVTTNVWQAIDFAGNSSTCSFSITVLDAQAPVITCPANIVRNSDPDKCSSITTYPLPTATDNCPGVTITLQSGLPSGADFPVGITTNVYRATDASGNNAQCSFTVRVNDVQAPVAVCPPAVTLPNDPGQCGRSVNWTGQASGTDNCGISGNSSNNPGYFNVGTHTVIHTVSDAAGNQNTCAQTVTINDVQFPAITCPATIVVDTDDSDCVATVDFAAAGNDNCPGFTIDYSSAPGTAFDPGYNNVTATITDAAGNTSSCTFLVRVNNREELCNGVDDDCDGLVDESDDWDAVAKVLAPDGGAQDQFGISVDIHGDFAIVGSDQKIPNGNSFGAAYILQRGPDGWAPVAKLLPSGVETGDLYGISVTIGADYAAVGAPLDDDQIGNEGAVYIFARDASDNWVFVKKIHAGDADAGDNFGTSLSMDGHRLMVGASLDDESGANAGAAYIFEKDLGGADNWGQAAKLLATTGAADDHMGTSVSLDGDYAVAGAPNVDGFFQNAGAAYVFGRNQGGADAWGQVARMRSQQSQQDDNFGISVGISGSWAIVGANQNDIKGNNAGAAFLFYQNYAGINNIWAQNSILFDFNGSAGDRFGTSVSIDGDYAAVGSRFDNPFGEGSGRGFVYEKQEDNNWLEVAQITDGAGQPNDNLGASVAIHGRTIIAGAPLDNNGTNNDEGSVTLYEGVCADARPARLASRSDDAMINGSVHSYPVPFSDVLYVDIRDMQSDDMQVTVINALGQVVAELYQGVVENDMILQWRPTSNATEGIYFLRLRTEQKTITQTVVLSRQR